MTINDEQEMRLNKIYNEFTICCENANEAYHALSSAVDRMYLLRDEFRSFLDNILYPPK